MTKEITKSIILQEIQDKFKLREWEHARFLFDETVVPTYEISKHLSKWKSAMTQLSITGIAGRPFYTLGENVQWELARYVVVLVGGTYTVSGVYIRRKDSTDFTYLDLTAGQNVSYAVDLPKNAILQPGDALGVNIDGYSVTGNLRLYIDYKETETR